MNQFRVAATGHSGQQDSPEGQALHHISREVVTEEDERLLLAQLVRVGNVRNQLREAVAVFRNQFGG